MKQGKNTTTQNIITAALTSSSSVTLSLRFTSATSKSSASQSCTTKESDTTSRDLGHRVCVSVHVWREHYPPLALALELTLTALPAFTLACLKTCKESRDSQQHMHSAA
jgi:hypothetical protein